MQSRGNVYGGGGSSLSSAVLDAVEANEGRRGDSVDSRSGLSSQGALDRGRRVSSDSVFRRVDMGKVGSMEFGIGIFN